MTIELLGLDYSPPLYQLSYRERILRQPGIEPRANAWKAFMLPLHHWRKSHSNV